jgi:SAM-dependent methyltransferase
MVGSMYDVTAEFYDLLHAADYLRVTERLLDRWLGEPAVAVLDVGAGTGLGTVALAARCHTPIHAIEPAASMRAILLSRLAGRSALLHRITVHAAPVEHLDLEAMADFALCLNTMSTLDERARRDGLAAIARAMVAGGRLLVERPPENLGPTRTTLPTWPLGEDRYGGETERIRVGPDEIEWRFTYRVVRGDAVVREATEVFRGYLISAAAFDEELRAAGFEPEHTDEPDFVIARRRPRQNPATPQARG